MQVMLGVSLRARWDATLVLTIGTAAVLPNEECAIEHRQIYDNIGEEE